VRTPILDLFRPGVLALSRYYFGLGLSGVQHIPQTGPLVIAPNHQTYADPVLVTIPVRRPVHYMAWSRLFTIPGLGGFIRRSLDGTVGRFKAGAFRLAVYHGAPVLPVTIDGGYEAWPPGRVWPRRGRMTITYHEPLRADQSLPAREAARDLAERARAAIVASLPASAATSA